MYLHTAETVLENIPAVCFWKDSSGVYLGANRAALDFIKYKTNDLIGITDYESHWKNIADEAKERDSFVLKGNIHYHLEHVVISDGTTRFLLVKKAPLYASSNKITALVGVGFHLDRNNYHNLISALALSGLKLSDFISKTNKSREDFCYKNIYFTKREAQIISYILKGRTASQIGNGLFMSNRTVEHYIEKIKQKLNCKNKSELIDLAFKQGFIDLLFLDIK